MAKFEEADPRWKVKDLGDQGKNVNGWHWNEKDSFPWFKHQFTENFDDTVLFEGATNGPAGLLCDLKCWKLDKCSGEASITKRKGTKVIVLYEIELCIKWEVTLKNTAGETVATSKGSYEMPCIDTVEDVDKFEIQVKYNKTGKDVEAANSYAKSQGEPEVRRKIVGIIMQLKEEAGQSVSGGAGADSPLTSAVPLPSLHPANTAAPKAAAATATAPKTSAGTGSKEVRSIEVSSTFAAPAKEVFDCFTVSQKCMAFTQSRVQVGTTVGEPFMLYDGAVTGKLVECDPNKKLVYDWRQTAWCEGDLSKCTITFDEETPGSTKLILKQTGIPYKDAHGNDDMPHVVSEGWKRNFFDRIKMVFGYGAPEFS